MMECITDVSQNMAVKSLQSGGYRPVSTKQPVESRKANRGSIPNWNKKIEWRRCSTIRRIPEHGDWRIGKYNYGEGIYLGIKPSWLQTQVPSDVRNMNFENIENRPISKELDFENPLVEILSLPPYFFSPSVKEICYESGYS